jgi:hypothetical protein
MMLTEIRWTDQKNHFWTDDLLSLIEETPRYVQAFGFAGKDAAKTVSSSGQRPGDMYVEIARIIFVEGANIEYAEDDLDELAHVIKNRITT